MNFSVSLAMLVLAAISTQVTPVAQKNQRKPGHSSEATKSAESTAPAEQARATTTTTAAATCAGHNLILGSADYNQKPPCYADRTCVLAACTFDGLGSAQGYTERSSDGVALGFAYFNVTSVSKVKLCGGSLYANYAELRHACDFDYVTRACQLLTMPDDLKSLAATALANAGGYAPNGRVLVKLPSEAGFYFSAADVDNGLAVDDVNLISDRVINDNATSAMHALSLNILEEKIRALLQAQDSMLMCT